ncbi:hypothetical protein, partial [Kitasatospora sp. NPDC059800]|uniref:hypothetical protein n=1 Tax=Kitasatospora sp. NPDC059800 TaxID=3346951 RepID=UPI003663955F
RPGARLALLADAAARSRLVPALRQLVAVQRPHATAETSSTQVCPPHGSVGGSPPCRTEP